MVLQVRRWLPERELILVADMGFAALELLAALSRRGVICITRLRLDAALYEPAPPRRPGTNGRPRTKGARLPNLSEVLTRTSTRWRRVTVPGWYGEGDRVVEFCSATAVWRHGGMPIVPIRWVLLRDPLGRFSPQALLCTDPKRDPLQIIRWFICVGRSRSPSRRLALISVCRPSGNGRIVLSRDPHPACSGCSRS
jgi:hypothetical protein